MCTKSDNDVRLMSAEAATDYVRTMVQRESRGPGDIDNAIGRIEARYGLPFWTLKHLRKGNAKTIDASMFGRIRAAYYDMCQRQVNSLLHEIEMGNLVGDDTLADFETEARSLAAKIAAKRETLK